MLSIPPIIDMIKNHVELTLVSVLTCVTKEIDFITDSLMLPVSMLYKYVPVAINNMIRPIVMATFFRITFSTSFLPDSPGIKGFSGYYFINVFFK